MSGFLKQKLVLRKHLSPLYNHVHLSWLWASPYIWRIEGNGRFGSPCCVWSRKPAGDGACIQQSCWKQGSTRNDCVWLHLRSPQVSKQVPSSSAVKTHFTRCKRCKSWLFVAQDDRKIDENKKVLFSTEIPLYYNERKHWLILKCYVIIFVGQCACSTEMLNVLWLQHGTKQLYCCCGSAAQRRSHTVQTQR